MNTPSVRGPDPVAWLTCARIEARRWAACPRTWMQWVMSAEAE